MILDLEVTGSILGGGTNSLLRCTPPRGFRFTRLVTRTALARLPPRKPQSVFVQRQPTEKPAVVVDHEEAIHAPQRGQGPKAAGIAASLLPREIQLSRNRLQSCLAT